MAAVAIHVAAVGELVPAETFRQQTSHSRLMQRGLQMVAISEHAFNLFVDFETFDADIEKAKSADDDWTKEGSVEDKVGAVKLALVKVQSYVKEFFNVTFQEQLKFPETKCGGNRYKFGPKLLKNVDFYLYVFLQNNPNSESPVEALNCLVEKSNGRPVVGIFLVNMLMTPSTAPDVYQLFRRYLHEYFHMLGFSSNVFNNFPGTNKEGELTSSANLTSQTGETVPVSYFTEERIKQASQTYFGCPSLEGLPLDYPSENRTTGDHLNFLLMPYSLMNPVPTVDPVIDNLTIATLNSTGWYKVGTTAAERETWSGFDKTKYIPEDPCDVVTKVCPAVLNSCTAEQATNSALRCSADRTRKELCSVHPKYANFSETLQCPMWQKTAQYCRDEAGTHDNWNEEVETKSTSSLCFMMALEEAAEDTLEPRCLKYECSTLETEDMNQTMLVLSFTNGTTVNCTEEELMVVVDSEDPTKVITIKCPDPLSLCPDVNAVSNEEVEATPTCHIDCTTGGLGLCMSNEECFCFFGKDESTVSGCAESLPEESANATSTSKFSSLYLQVTVLIKAFLLSLTIG